MTSIKRFTVEKDALKVLTPNEKKIIPLLIRAAELVNKIFILQENYINNGANFYPRDAVKSEIEEAAKKDRGIFSPFTVVRRDNTNNLISTPYHKEYKKEIAPIVKNLNEAQKICQNKSFKRYLKAAILAINEGKYQEADIAWLAIKNCNIHFTIGPHERYLDKLFFIKRAYQASVGVVDKKRTEKAKNIRDILYTTFGSRIHRTIPPSIVDMQVTDCFIFSGLLGRLLFTRQFLPAETETVEKYGARIMGYRCCINYKFNKLIYPIYKAVFEKNFKARYSKELLNKGMYYYVLLNSLVQHLHRYRDSRTRLRELFPILDEANNSVSGVQHAKHLVLKGMIDQKELEAIMVIQICWIFSEWVLSKKSSLRDSYLKGDALTFNFLKREEALQERDGISWPNFAKMFFEMENLSVIFTRYLEEGSYEEAQEFLSKYLTLEPLKAFDLRLKNIKPI